MAARKLIKARYILEFVVVIVTIREVTWGDATKPKRLPLRAKKGYLVALKHALKNR